MKPNPSFHDKINPNHVKQIIQTYFTNPAQSMEVNQGHTLLHEGQNNNKLFYVTNGILEGFWLDKDGHKIESFEAVTGSFIGIPSFFSDTNISLHTVVAKKDSTLHYITREQKLIPFNNAASLEEQFMPIVINELIHRQLHVQQLAFERAQTQKVLAHHEKMAALGKISAGIAHELNNAISVIQHSTEWLSKSIKSLIKKNDAFGSNMFDEGLACGRQLSSREIRKKAQALAKTCRIPLASANHLAQMQLSPDQEQNAAKNLKELEEKYQSWELGATMHDMQTASSHAAHVVRSVKALGSNSNLQANIDVNETIEEAVTLLTSPLRKVQFEKELQPVAPITANRGELVQVWVNIVQNAVESLMADKIEHPLVRVESTMLATSVRVKISDNGNGIPRDILHKIFEPQFTTKSGEASVGLGLGLTFVDRIITSHNGTIKVESKPGNTTFTITLPEGDEHEQTRHHLR